MPTCPAQDQHTLPYLLALHRTPKIGPRRFLKLLQHFDPICEVFKAPRETLMQLGIPNEAICHLKKPNWHGVEKDLAWAEQEGHRIISYQSAQYPTRLKHIFDPPMLLFLKGSIDLLPLPQLAMVGSRNPTPSGIGIAQHFTQLLCDQGITITSGLALGIDTASHIAALKASGRTLAVLGTGLDVIYPKRHTKLAERLAQTGLLVSEYPLGTPARAENFPRRNRIISGLSLGVLVVEATLKSGSLITARLAAEQGREVFAVPGSIHNPLSRGCHFLIRQGAKLVESVRDILEELPPYAQSHAQKIGKNTQSCKCSDSKNLPPIPDQNAKSLLEHIGFETTSPDMLVARTGQSITEITAALCTLELAGVINSVPGGYVRLR